MKAEAVSEAKFRMVFESSRDAIMLLDKQGFFDCNRATLEMFGYATELRSMTQGRANYSMQFAAYEQAPKSVSEEVVAKAAG